MPSLFDGLRLPEASSLNGFAGNRIDRRSEKRSEGSIAAALADPGARLYLFSGDKALLEAGIDPLFAAGEARASAFRREADGVLLGWLPDGPRLAAMVPETTPLDETAIRLVDLRSLAVEGARVAGASRRAGAGAERSATGTHATASAPSAGSRR